MSGRFAGTGQALWRRIGLVLAAFALLSQSVALAAPPMAAPGDARAAAADLAALFGQTVVVCADISQPQKLPAHGPHDACPLCQIVAQAAALSAPDAPPLPSPTLRAATQLDRVADTTRPPGSPRAFALARGPPALT